MSKSQTNEVSIPNAWRRPTGGAMLLLLASACAGYSLVRGDAPFGARRIAVVPFQEDAPVGLSTELSRELTTLLAADGVEVTMDAASADGVLTGVVVSATTRTSPVASAGARIPAYRLTAVVRAHFSAGERELWRAEVRADDAFLPSESQVTVETTQTLETEANRRRALSRLAMTLARDLHQRLLVASTVAGGD